MLLASKQMLILYKYAETLRYQILILPLVSEGDEQLQFWGIAKFFEGYFGAKVQENLIVCTIFQKLGDKCRNSYVCHSIKFWGRHNDVFSQMSAEFTETVYFVIPEPWIHVNYICYLVVTNKMTKKKLQNLRLTNAKYVPEFSWKT